MWVFQSWGKAALSSDERQMAAHGSVERAFPPEIRCFVVRLLLPNQELQSTSTFSPAATSPNHWVGRAENADQFNLTHRALARDATNAANGLRQLPRRRFSVSRVVASLWRMSANDC